MIKILATFCLVSTVFFSHAQLSVYVKFTPKDGTTLLDENLQASPAHKGEIPLTTFSDNDEQTLNIGGTSGGAGAGKILFNPTTFSKLSGANSAKFFSLMAAGTSFKKVEFSFYNSQDQLVFRETLGTVAFKSIQRAAGSCSGDCPGVIENYTIEYGQKVLTTYVLDKSGRPSNSYSYGWDRIRNTALDNPADL